MELREQLELVEVNYSNADKKVVFTFLDIEREQIRTVQFNKQKYDNGKFVDDEKKAAQVDEWCQKYFGCEFSKLASQVGTKHDVYCYENFNSLWESDTVSKFTSDMVGTIIQTKIKEIVVDNVAIRIRYDYDGKTYESKMTFATYLESMKKWFEDPDLKEKRFKQFLEKFGVCVDDREVLVGHDLMVEVKSAFGSNYYGDVKKFPKK